MNGCRCVCGGWGSGPGAARWPGRRERIEWLEEYQRDLEQQAADVADEIRRLREQSQPGS